MISTKAVAKGKGTLNQRALVIQEALQERKFYLNSEGREAFEETLQKKGIQSETTSRTRYNNDKPIPLVVKSESKKSIFGEQEQLLPPQRKPDISPQREY